MQHAVTAFLVLVVILMTYVAEAATVEEYIKSKCVPEYGRDRGFEKARYYTPIVERYAKRFEVDPFLLASLIWYESNYDPRALSPVGARGLMQVMPVHWRSHGYRSLLAGGWRDRVDVQMELGCRILTGYHKLVAMRYKGMPDVSIWHRTLVSYNMGPAYANRGGSRYSRAILGDAAATR